MKALIIGIVLGFLIICIPVPYFFLFYFWLPITSITLLVCGLFSLDNGGKYKPAFIGSAIFMITYICWSWLPPEIASRTAKTAIEHNDAAHKLASRSIFFGSDVRAFEHYKKAAEMNNIKALLTVGKSYLYGWYHGEYNREKAKNWLIRAADLGSEEAMKILGSNYHFPKEDKK